MKILLLAYKSLISRKLTVVLTLLSIGVSVFLLLGVLRLKTSVEDGFTNTISGTDLVVGARAGEEQLVLASVFQIGNLNNVVSWETYKNFKNNNKIHWTIPISLGDTHKGYKVIGTNEDFFKHYKYANKNSLSLAKGHSFNDLFDVIIGAEVAQKENYSLGSEIAIQHGSNEIEKHDHEHSDFIIAGVLNKTGTPIDKSIFITLKAFEGIHLNYVNGKRDKDIQFSALELREFDIIPQNISVFFVGLHSKTDLLTVQNTINNYIKEPLTAASPALTLINLWNIMANVEIVLLIISIFVVLIALISMFLTLLAGIRERRREMAIFRSLGATINDIYFLILGESLIISIGGVFIGVFLLVSSTLIIKPYLESNFGLILNSIWIIELNDIIILCGFLITGFLIGVIPAYRMHQFSLKDGLTIKL